MTRSLCALGAILGLLSGCIPDIGTTDKVDVPPAVSSPLAAGEKLSILGVGDFGNDDDVVTCVRAAAAKADATLAMMPPQAFRDDLFPWFEPSTMPRTPEQLATSMSQPAVKAKISALNLHYVILVGGGTSSSSRDDVGLTGFPGLGAEWETETSRLSGSILDLKEARWLGSLDLSVSATDSVAVIGLLPVGTISVTEGPACRELGRQIAAYLTGRPAPEPERPREETKPSE